jgi:hypothetical protein
MTSNHGSPSARRAALARGVGVAFLLGAFALVGAIAPACGNPVIDTKIEALGGEQAGVPPGPYHRPGQPCTLCHSDYYGVSPKIVIGGTVFADLNSFKTVEDVEVVLTDSIGETRTLVTNCIGNFYITADTWNPQFPLAAEIRFPVYNTDGTEQTDPTDKSKVIRKVKAMGSVISRDGSCASCHSLYGRKPEVDAAGTVLRYDSTGWIYCNAADDTNFFPEVRSTCVGKPPTNGVTTTTSTAATGGG